MRRFVGNYDRARQRMVETQLRGRGITDPRTLAAMARVPRHLFVEEALAAKAYNDHPLPVGHGQTISQPYIVALMTQALGLTGSEKVLEIGTGSGYQAAVLSCLARTVYTVERIQPLLVRARKVFDAIGAVNIKSRLDDGTLGWAEEAPFDAIIVTAGGPSLPMPLVEQLGDPGRMVIPVGDRQSQDLVLIEKENGATRERLIERVRFVDLVGKYGWD